MQFVDVLAARERMVVCRFWATSTRSSGKLFFRNVPARYPISGFALANRDGGLHSADMETDPIIRCLRNDQFAARSGIELIEVGPGFARAKMSVHPHHLNGVGTVQGGAIFTLADFAFAAASNSHGTVAVAVNVSISFLKAGRDGHLWAEAREISCNSKLGSYTVEVKNDAGELIAHFQGMAYRKPDKLPVD